VLKEGGGKEGGKGGGREGGLRVRGPLLVSPLCPLLELLEAFQQGKAQVASVVDTVRRKEGGKEGGREEGV